MSTTQVDAAAIRRGVIEILQGIAPEVDGPGLIHDRSLRSQVDLDSYDWLHFLLELHERFDVEIPEADYGRLSTIDQLVEYLHARASH